MSTLTFTCACCGYQTFDEPPGSFDICDICYWQDDPVQLIDPAFAGGANTLSLIECQNNYIRFGASEDRFRNHVRAASDGDVRDVHWRPVVESDLNSDSDMPEIIDGVGGRLEDWYYWLRKAI